MPKKNTLLLLGIVIFGFTLRLIAVLKFGDFWFDEMFSFIYSQKPWVESLRFWTWETNPPLHMFMLKLWLYVFPHTEFFARLPSLFFGVSTIVAVHTLTRRLFNQTAALVSALFIAIYPYHIFLSAMARGYALLMLLVALSIDSFFIIYASEKPKTKKLYAYFFLSHTLLLYTHLTAAVIFVSELAFLFTFRRTIWRQWCISYGIIFLAWLPWAIPSLFAKATKETLDLGWFFNIHLTPQTIASAVQPIFGSFGPWQLTLITTTICLIVILCVFKKITREKYAGIFLIITPILLTLIGVGLFGLWNFKFTVVVVPIAAILLGLSFSHWKLFTPVKILLAACAFAPGIITMMAAFPMMPWQPLNKCMQNNSVVGSKQALVYLHFVDKVLFEKYYTATIPAISFRPAPADNDWDRIVITENYWRMRRSLAETNQWAERVQLNSFDEVFVFSTNDNNGIPIDEYFKNNGWAIEDNSCKGPYVGSNVVVRYVHK